MVSLIHSIIGIHKGMSRQDFWGLFMLTSLIDFYIIAYVLH